MKKIVLLLLISILYMPVCSIAQQKARTIIASVTQKGNEIDFTLTSSKPFIFANNRYILHIGDKEFYRNTQSKDNGTGTMTFFIPASDFAALSEGADVYLTYGQLPQNTRSPQELGKEEYLPFWSLGTFSRSILTR